MSSNVKGDHYPHVIFVAIEGLDTRPEPPLYPDSLSDNNNRVMRIVRKY